MEKIFRKKSLKNSSDFLEVLYEDSQNNCRIMTRHFRKLAKKYQKLRSSCKKELMEKVKLICRGDEESIQLMEKYLNIFIESMDNENCFYIMEHHKQRNKRGN